VDNFENKEKEVSSDENQVKEDVSDEFEPSNNEDTTDTITNSEKEKEILEEYKEAIKESHMDSLQFDSREETINKLNLLKSIYGEKEFLKKSEQVGSDVYILANRIKTYSSADEFERISLDKKDVGLLKNKYVDDKHSFMDVSKNPNKDYKGAVLSGKEALLVLNAKNKSNRKVWLYNSGIYVILRGPTLTELNTAYNRIIDEINNYQYEFGMHYYLFNDFVIKEAVLDLIYKLIIDTNYVGWSRNKAIFDVISLPDYRVLLHAIGSLMYQDKYPYYFACTNTNTSNGKPCTHIETVEIDLRKIRFNNYSMIPEEAMDILYKSGNRTKEEIIKYKELLNLNKYIYLGEDYRGMTKIPSINEYTEFGKKFNRSIIEAIHLDDDKKIEQYIKYNYYKVFTIWLDYVEMMNEDIVSAKFVDEETIANLLDIVQLEDTDFGDKMTEFIHDISISHIAIPFNGCPSCNYIPEYCKNGYITFDPQSHFFSQSVMRLALNVWNQKL
jgi:hypothetical protein